jgi:hypothetical protein
VWLGLIHAITGGLIINPVLKGVLLVKGKEARIHNKNFEVVFIRRNPVSLIHREMEPLYLQVRTLMSKIAQTQVININSYKSRLSRLQGHRTKRGLIDGIGELSKTLFGIATSKDLRKVKDTVNELVMQHNEQRIIVRDLVVCVNETQEQLDTVTTTVNTLIVHVNQLQQDFENLVRRRLTEIGTRLVNTEMVSILESCMSLLEGYVADGRQLQETFQHVRDMAVIGHVTESLVSPDKLNELRQALTFTVSNKWIYTNLEVRLINLDNDAVGYWLAIPQLEQEPYTQWTLVSVPFPAGALLHQLRPETTGDIAVGQETGKIIERTFCQYSEPEVCTTPIKYDHLPCVQGLLAQDPQRMENCKTVIVPHEKDVVRRVSPSSLLVYTEGEKLNERCADERPVTHNIVSGTYLIRVPAGCVVEAENGWTFSSLMVEHLDVNLDNVFQVQINFNVTLPTIKPIFVNYTQIDNLVTKKLKDLPSLDGLRPIKLVQLSGSVCGIIALIFILVITGLIFLYRKYKLCKKAKHFAVKYVPTAKESEPEIKIQECDSNATNVETKPGWQPTSFISGVKPLWPSLGPELKPKE